MEIPENAREPNAKVNTVQRVRPVGELNMEAVELFTRLLIGLSAEGAEMLLTRLRAYQPEIGQIVTKAPLEPELDDASRVELIRYLAVGTAVRAQRGSLRMAHDTAAVATSATRSIFDLLDRATDNIVTRPFRRPFEALAGRLNDEIGASVVVGHKELSEGRVLARETTIDFIDDFIAYLSSSPELAELVSDQIGQQSLSVAGAVTEGGRTVTLEADNALEGLIRRLLKRPARKDLPRSPFAGKPDAVYHPGPVSTMGTDSTPSTALHDPRGGEE